jgi:AsmA protein
MAAAELQTLLPSLAIVMPAGSRLEGGTVTVALAMEGPADKLVTSGSLSLDKTKLTGFDLPKKMSSLEKLAGIKGGPDTQIDTLSAVVRVAPDGMSAHDIRLVVPSIGDLSGGGSVSPANDLDFRVSALVHASGVLAVVGNTPIPFTVGGTCADPVFRPDLKAAVKEEMKSVGAGLGKAAGGLVRGLLSGKKN